MRSLMRTHAHELGFLNEGGELGRLMRTHDWSGSPLGAPQAWSQPLRTVTSVMLGSQFPMFVAWGGELGFLYNDAYAGLLGAKHPAALGARIEDVWSEIWSDISPLIDTAMAGQATFSEDLPLIVNRRGFEEQAWFTFSYSPVKDESGAVAGMFCAVAETTARVLAERAVWAERDRAQGVLDNMGEAFVLLDREFRIVDMNAEAMRLENRPKEAILGKTHWEAHADAAPELGELYRKAMRERQAASLLHRYVWPDGRDTWIDMRAYPASDGLAVFYRDATERVVAEQRLRESEARFRGVFNSRLTGLTVFDASTGRTLAINDTFLNMTGHTRAEFETQAWNWRDFTPPEHLHLDEVAIRQALERGSWDTYEKEYYRKDGRRFPVRLSAASLTGEHGKVVVAVEDVTAEKAAREALASSEALARAQADEIASIYNAAPVGLCVIDRDLRYVRINERLAEINGVPAADHIGRTVQEVVPELNEQVIAMMRRVLEGEEVWNVELSGTTPAQPGVERTWRENWLPIRNAEGAITGVAVSAEEITEAKRVQAALEESETRFRNMADQAPVMMWVTDASGCCTYLNARWYEFTGQEPGQGEGYGWLDAIHPDDRPLAEQAFVSATAERRNYRFDFRLRRSDGVYRWSIDAADARFAEDGDFLGYVGSVIDIEDRKEMEAALEQRVAEALAEKRLFAEIVEATDASVQAVDQDFRFLAINKTAKHDYERVFGVRPQAGQIVMDILAHLPAECEAAQQVWARVLKGEAYSETRWWGDDALGRRAFETHFKPLLNSDGKQVGAFVFAQDITERMREQERLAAAEAARREADALYRAYFENTAEALFVVNVLEDGGFTIEDLNPAHQASIGLPLAEVYGKRIDEILPPILSEPVIAHYRRALIATGVYQYREAFELHGRTTYWDTVLVPVHGENGRIIRLIGSSRDLTRQRAAEEQLRQSQKMEAMGQLTGGVAHDFNNLLTPIIGSLDMLMRRGLGNEREQRLVGGALQSAERAKTLVQRLLAFARRQPLQATAVNLPQLVSGLAGLIESTLGPKVDVRVELDDDLPPARADANQLEMALLNLAVNARDAMPHGGVLTISAKHEIIRQERASKLEAGHYIRLAVDDSGLGMDALTLARAIEPFFSTKGIGKGTGLGLSMVHGLAAQLGGELTIESEPGRGTRVELWLPTSPEPATGEEARLAAPLANVRGRVLLVDDEELVRMSTADMLNDMGYEVIEAASGEEALRLFDQVNPPDLLVTDHLMPGMSGVELIREIRLLKADLPVLIVSGYAEVDGIAPDLPRLTKPFRNAELADRLSTLRPMETGIG
ncbi:MAG TPA: PAS domain-containing protein [Sphingomonas sp.]